MFASRKLRQSGLSVCLFFEYSACFGMLLCLEPARIILIGSHSLFVQQESRKLCKKGTKEHTTWSIAGYPIFDDLSACVDALSESLALSLCALNGLSP